MKKIITCSLFVLFFSTVFGQTSNTTDYADKKLQFYKLYEVYKFNIDNNITAIKPTDPNGLFMIDENNNMVDIDHNVINNQQTDFLSRQLLGNRGDAVTSYLYSQSTRTYNAITGGTVVATGAIDDNSYPGLSIGFPFNFNGTDYTTLGVTSNGYIWFGPVIPSTSDRSPISQTAAYDGAVSAFGYDLIGLSSGEIRIQTQGSAPNRYCTVQFKNWASYNVTTDTLNFQIILYEAGDSVAIQYGPIVKDATSRLPQVGMRGASNADFNNRTTTTDWTATTAGTLNTATCTFLNTVFPPAGFTFTYTPVSMSYVSSTTAQLYPGIPVYSNALNVQIIQIQVVMSGTLIPNLATSFRLGTNGSTNPTTDITNAKLYYTGISNSFSSTNLFGTAVSPNGAFSITGSQALSDGTNYFWLTYDVPGTATTGDTLDAQCDSITIAGISRVPTVTAPSGNRIIAGSTLCGTKTIPGDYPNFAAAITELNTNGVCGTGVTFNVTAGFVDTAANLVISSSGSLSGPVIFQKSGIGANPLIIAGIGTGTLDGIIKLSGADYITFNGIDLQENPANTTTTTQMEWGYALLKVDGTNGCQNITIKNCNITLNKTNTSAIGIYAANHTVSSITALTVTAASGANSNNKFYSNIIQNVNTGISITGYSGAAFYDQNNEVGTDIGQNKISNYATTTTAYGVYGIYQNGIKVFNTNINNSGGAASTSTLYGIFLSTGINSNVDIYGDTVTVAGGGTTTQLAGIYNNMGTTGTNNTVNIYNNVVQNCTYATATTAATYYLYHSASCYNFNAYGNKVINNTYGSASVTATGTIGYFYTLGGAATNNIWQIYNNTVSNNYRIQSALSTGTTYGIYNGGSGPSLNAYGNVLTDVTMNNTSTNYLFYMGGAPVNFNCYNNTVKNITRNASAGATYCYYLTGGTAGGIHNIYNNSLNNLTLTTTGATYCLYSSASVDKNIYQDTVYGINSNGAIYGLYLAGGLTSNMNNNNIYGLTSTAGSIYSTYITSGTTNNFYLNNVHDNSSTSSSVYGTYILGGTTNNYYQNRIYGMISSTQQGTGVLINGGVTNNVYNNFISDIGATASTLTPGVYGINISAGTTDNVYFNTVYLNATSSSATTFGSAGIYASTTPTLDLRNNIIVNMSTPGPGGGFTVAYQRSSTTLSTYANTSNNNDFHAGTPGAARLIYYDGINSDQTIGDYKTRVAPRDSNSFTENPPFINVSTTPYNLHISASTPTGVESAGLPVSSPIVITTDYDGQTRNAATPDIGADEGTFTPGDLQAPQITYTPLPNIGTVSNRNLIATITDNVSLNNTPPNDPRIYFKRGINGVFKYRNKTSQAGNDFTFTIVIDSLPGLAIGDTVFYYVAAQDMAPTPNIATNPAGGSGINPPGTVPPSSPNFYIIIQSPMSGIFTIPGNYPTIAAAVGDMNLRGINGPCTFNVAAGHTEISSNITVQVTGTASWPIIFQRSGSVDSKNINGLKNDQPLINNNPAIIAAPGVGTLDGIIKLAGTDYITFDGIDVRDTSSNATTITQMEWGYALLKVDGTNGCRYVSIKNCGITLNKTNLSTVGIYSANHGVSSLTTFTVTDTLGSNSYNKFYSNTISDVNSGITITGYADATPYIYYDQNNEIGSTGTLQNRILNFGSSTTAYGIYGINQNNIKIFSTNVNNSGGAASISTLYGIYMTTGNNSNVDIYNDTVTVIGGGTTGTMGAIYNVMGSSGTSNTVNIYNNVVQNCTYDGATSPTQYYILNSSSCFNLNMYNNKVINNTYGSASATATGTFYYLYVGGGSTTCNIWQVYNNIVSNNSRVQTALSTGTTYLMYIPSAGPTLNVYGNTFSDLTLPSTSTNYGVYMLSSAVSTYNYYNNVIRNVSRPNLSTGGFYCFYQTSGAAAGTANIYSNSINNISISGAGLIYGLYSSATMDKNIYQDTIYNLNSAGGAVYGIYSSTGNTTNIYRNKIYGLNSNTATTGAAYGAYLAGGTTNNFYNNFMSDIQAPASTSTLGAVGLYISGGTTDNIFYNTIYLNAVSNSTTTFGTAGIYASTTPTVDMRNNIIDNVSTPGPTGGYTTAYYRSSTTLTTYSNNSNNNGFYAGTPAYNKVIYYDGTNADSVFTSYQARVAPRDNNSFTENPPFVNVSTTPYDLHISPSTPTHVESGGIPVSAPIVITTDYDNQTRNATTPDVGADEGNFTPYILPPANVTLKVIPGGFYNTSTGTLNMRDTIKALLIDSTGCLRSDSTKAVLDSVTFTANISFANASTGSYYLYVFHRNHVFISARYEQSIIRGSTVSYDFTTDSSKTYGNNVIKVATSPVLWGMIPGEANQDGYVDGLDQTLWIFDNGLEGYRSTDFNGDLYVDGLDQTIWILMNGLNYSVPCELTFENPAEHTRKVQTINNRETERIYSPKQNK